MRKPFSWRGAVLALIIGFFAIPTAAPAVTANGLVGTWEGIDAHSGIRNRLTLTKKKYGHGWQSAFLDRFTKDGHEINYIGGGRRLGIDKSRPRGCRLVLYFFGAAERGVGLGDIIEKRMSIRMVTRTQMKIICPAGADRWGPNRYVRISDPKEK